MGKLRIPDAARGFTYIQDTTPANNPQIGDTWYNTSDGKAYVYTPAGWEPTKGWTQCWEKNPLYIKIEPTSAFIDTDGGTVSLTVTVKNTDVGTCGQTTFTLAVVDSNSDDFDPSELSATTVSLGPYQETTLTLTVKDKIGGVIGTGRNDVYITATAPDHPDAQSNTVTVELQGAAAECTPQAPSVSISPASQTISTDGGTAYYTVTITNNDPTSCTATTFTLTAVDSNIDNFEPSVLNQTSVTLNPGESVNVTLFVRDKAGNYPGTVVSNNTYVIVSSVVHGDVTSNTITTTLDGEAIGYPYGYVCGGNYYTGSWVTFSTIDRFQFPFDSGTATHVGNLAVNNECYGGCNSTQYGYTAGSQTDGSGTTSYIHRIEFPFDSGTALIAGYQTKNVNDPSCCGCSTHGYVCGGNYYTGSWVPFSTIDRFQFPFDSGTATHVGNLSETRCGLAANNSSIYGYVCGGYNSSSGLTTIDRFQFPFDSGNATHVGNLNGTKGWVAANNSSTNGYVCGGRDDYSTFSTIDRFQFPFDSGTATYVGDLSAARRALVANNSSTHGYVCGGHIDFSYLSTIDRFQFPFDSGTATHVGYLNVARGELGGMDTVDFVQIFK